MTDTAPYGSWHSPVTRELLVSDAVGLMFPLESDGSTYWIEGRPSEGGRHVIVELAPDGSRRDVTPEGYGARTLAHEYGGMAYAVRDGVVWFSNLADQRMYRIDPGGEPRPVTAEPPLPMAWRYADLTVSPDGRHIVCVRERHGEDSPHDVVNEIVAVPADGSGEPVLLAGGHDFYSNPTLSPDGARLAWLCWDRPRMPWDGTELFEAPVDAVLHPGEARLVAGGEDESVVQPRYSPDGVLHYVSDRSGWWNLYAEGRSGSLAPRDAEFAVPAWVFGQADYAFVLGGIAVLWGEDGLDHLGLISPDGKLDEVDTPMTSWAMVRPAERGVVGVAGSATRPAAVVRVELPGGALEVLRRSRPDAVDPAELSLPEPIEFPTEGGLTAHALFYPPHNTRYRVPEGELPPLVVMSHGGPTASTSSMLNYVIQFWTTRGFAVVDVNYGGSSGYGREYRNRLRDAWGIVDLDDCVNAARHLAREGRVDGARMVIRGGSAGGYTTLCAVTFRDVFAAGTSLFGVADLGALAEDTHKFESRYLDLLVGPWPEARAVYEARSPIYHTDLLRTPLLLLQGLEDRVVPPAQAEMMADALRSKGVPFAYIAFEGEQHGFRKAENIIRSIEAELYFYGRVLGFRPDDEIEPYEIEFEEKLAR